MKNVSLTLFLLFSTCYLFGQSIPQKINYQGIARKASGEPLSSKAIAIRLTFIVGGNSAYTETKSVTTNSFGLYNVVINDGSGTRSGSFENVNWASGTASLKTEIDPDNGTNFTDMGTTPLNSVPYALEAGRPNISELKDVTISSPEKGSLMQWNGTAWVNATPASVIKTYSLGGDIGVATQTIDASIKMLGPKVEIAVTSSSQVIVATITASLGYAASPNQNMRYGVCISQNTPSPTIGYMAGGNYLIMKNISSNANSTTSVTSTHSKTGLTPATYTVGFCVSSHSGSFTLSGSDYLNGTVMTY